MTYYLYLYYLSIIDTALKARKELIKTSNMTINFDPIFLL